MHTLIDNLVAIPLWPDAGTFISLPYNASRLCASYNCIMKGLIEQMFTVPTTTTLLFIMTLTLQWYRQNELAIDFFTEIVYLHVVSLVL
ncbi:hypothetical protein Llac01_11820 [Leuconostoc lactis]|nr:hypothetical protein LLA04_13610 [Leuconostoc lactis]GLY45805.1 hypothetical protein Llac01_11820 [Leuconostoc lactis]